MFVNSTVSQYPNLAFQFAFDQAGENFHTAALMLRWTRILGRLRRCCQKDSSMTSWPDQFPSGNQKRVFPGYITVSHTHCGLRLTKMSLVDFIGIGAPKCGTTWFSAQLEAHPQIGFE